jgi:tRNA(fMet)-specific endonuclease VapC
MVYLFDTNIVLAYFRADTTAQLVESQYQPFQADHIALISVISLGEINSLTMRNQWGETKKQKLALALQEFRVVDIYSKDIINKYAEIETYSQNKMPHRPLPTGVSARNMGKNDIWIAATASVINATLISTDADFHHLDKLFFDLAYITPNHS